MSLRYWLISGLLLVLAAGLLVTRPAAAGAPAGVIGHAPLPPHPCSGIIPEPPFSGLSPLSITWVPGMCTTDAYQAGYGDLTVWQAGGHSYAGIAGFAQRAFYIFNVDDPYTPVLLVNQGFPDGATTSTSIFSFHQGSTPYLSVTLRGTGTGCGFFVYNVTDPANPGFVGRQQGSDWCTVHEHFVSTDANGDADYAWLTMSAEAGSGYKIVVLDLRALPAMPETGRYERPDSNGGIFAHDVTVIGQRVFVAFWGGGLIIHDKETLAHTTNPAPLNPLDSIRPAGFNVHHAWPTTDGNHVFIEDEYQNNAGLEKIQLYNIANLAAPFYETGLVGEDVAATNRAHNLKILNVSPGHDLLFDGWYEAGTRGFDVDTTATPPRITPRLSHRLLQAPTGDFGDVWGVDFLPCTLQGKTRTCVYSSDMFFGLVVDALDTDPALDPYPPTSTIADPVPGQTITTCTYTVLGTAHDYWSGVARVEVRTDPAGAWQPAGGTDTWGFHWTVPRDGVYTLTSRATDAAGNVEEPTTSVQVTVAGGCGAATPTPPPPSATPPPPTAAPTAPTGEPPTSTPPPTLTAGPAATPSPVPSTTPCRVPFVDVQPGDYFYPAVQYFACRQVLGGYADGTFRPYNLTTRSQLVKILVLQFALPVVTPAAGGATFADVPPSHPFFAVVEAAAHAGLASGYPCGGPGEPCDRQQRPYFRPAAPVTRGQVAKLVVIAAGWAIGTPAGPPFADVPPSAPFAPYIAAAAAHGVIAGYSCGGPGEPCDSQQRPYFRPAGPATRGQIAKIVYAAWTSRLCLSPAAAATV
ncbi:MAG TPA: S-layer homology domain-containing protein [Chloroflexia bacterium]|nr:S-layer homology domain-containing protein [Chloroflexia bacterium]